MVIDTLQLDIIVNNKGTTARINSTTKALKDLHKVISDINGAGGVNGTINGGGGGSSSKGGSSRSSGSKSASSLMKNLNFGSMVAKLYFVRNITKQLGQDFAKVVQYGIDYEETLNLWQVAMKGNTAEARKFITEMNRAYGISEITLMNYQATFKNMLSSLGGINQEVAYGLSETLSQMALDYASLYNTSIKSAMTKFQAVLAGQVRPIRSESGYDITQATLYEVYKSIGGTKSVRQLSETEKRLLRILAVYRQMKDTAVGDYANTITSTANQTRYMFETIKDIATWIGVGANQWLKQSNLLLRINAYLVALKELAKSFAINMGHVEESEEKAQDPLAGMEEEWNGINKEVDNYNKKLLGFDKFQVLSSADTGDGADISAELLKAMQDYEEILDKAQNIALFGDAEKNIKGAYQILEDWGFKLEEIKDEEGNVIGQQWVKDGKTVKEVFEEIFTTIKGIFTFVGLMTKPWLVFAVAIEEAYWKNEDFRNSVNKMLTQLGGAGLKVFNALGDLFVEMAPYIARIVEKFVEIVDLLDELGLLEETIALVCAGLLLWKNRQTALKILEFVNTIRAKISVMRLLRTETDALNASNLLAGKGIGTFGTIMTSTYTRTMTLVAGISLLSSGLMDLQNWSDMSSLERASTILKIVAGAAFLAATAIASFHTAWSVGVAAATIAVGVAAIVASMITAQQAAKDMEKNVQMKAIGGLATKGSLFYAGEAGPELVTQTSGGGSTIMNMKQLEDAVARGFIRGFASTDKGYEDNDTTEVYVDGQRLFNIMRGTAKRNGYDFVRVG